MLLMVRDQAKWTGQLRFKHCLHRLCWPIVDLGNKQNFVSLDLYTNQSDILVATNFARFYLPFTTSVSLCFKNNRSLLVELSFIKILKIDFPPQLGIQQSDKSTNYGNDRHGQGNGYGYSRVEVLKVLMV